MGLSLIDAIGDEQTALDWMQAERDIDEDLSVREWTWHDEELPWPLSQLPRGAASILGGQSLIGTHPRLYALIQ